MCVVCRKEYSRDTARLVCSWCTDVEKLPSPQDIPHVKYVMCYATTIDVIPRYSNLSELNCSCTAITELPELEQIRFLNCSGTLIKQLPIYPKLTVLLCDMTRISNVPALSQLAHLDCSNTRVSSLPALPALRVLLCDATCIVEIPKCPLLEYVRCDNAVVYDANHRLATSISEVQYAVLCRAQRRIKTTCALLRYARSATFISWVYAPRGAGSARKRHRRSFKKK